ncbi:unnamed protein product [Malus baccata var. baccata]
MHKGENVQVLFMQFSLFHNPLSAPLESLVVLLLVAAYQDYKALKLSRYSYPDSKGITIQFIDKGDREEFINKGGTMGHINHAIPLVGSAFMDLDELLFIRSLHVG